MGAYIEELKKERAPMLKRYLNERNFSYWDTASKNWKIKKGDYQIFNKEDDETPIGKVSKDDKNRGGC